MAWSRVYVLFLFADLPPGCCYWLDYNPILQNEKLGAGDLVIEFALLLCEQLDLSIFDFGISTENEGQFLNEGLIRYKESYGASTTVADFYGLLL